MRDRGSLFVPPLPLAGGGADSAGGLAYNAPMLTDITEKEVQSEEERLLGRGQRYARVYLLTDCNNFFVSCERLFRPDLEDRPVLVLSNNDGCVVARSQEVRDLGVPMGVAVFKIRELIERHHIVCFSSNFNLYLDISQRIMRTLETLCEEVEIYSVDEAFLVLHDVSEEEAEEMAFKVRKTIACHIGVPVSVGVATSKTLAKLASHHAKQHLSETGGVYAVLNEVKRERLLRDNPVSEVWGVGRKLRERLNELQIETAYALSRCDLKKMRRLFSIVLVNTIRELNGEDVIEEGGTEGQAQIMWSRSFKERITALSDLEVALSSFTSEAAVRLRALKRYCRRVTVYLRTSLYGEGPHYAAEDTVLLDVPVADTRVLTQAALKILRRLYKPGFRYMKAGVILTDFTARRTFQGDLFRDSGEVDLKRLEEGDALMALLDKLNARERGTVYLGLAGAYAGDKRFTHKKQLSRAYTTSFEELPVLM